MATVFVKYYCCCNITIWTVSVQSVLHKQLATPVHTTPSVFNIWQTVLTVYADYQPSSLSYLLLIFLCFFSDFPVVTSSNPVEQSSSFSSTLISMCYTSSYPFIAAGSSCNRPSVCFVTISSSRPTLLSLKIIY